MVHWAALVHGCPLIETQLPEPLQAWEPAQSGLVSVPPAGMFTHVPGLPGMLQVWQLPEQALPQQTPSAQKPVAHCWAWVHAAAAGRFTLQVPLSQK